MMMLQRAVLLLSALVVTVPAYTQESHIARSKRDTGEGYYSDDWMWPYTGAGAWAGAGYPWGAATGGFAGAGYPVLANPFMPFWPFYQMPSIVPWYKGPHVCVETKYADQPDEFKEMMKDVPASLQRDQKSSQESCWGDSDCYFCRGWKMHNSKMTQYMTKYTCCHGFVRNPRGPGCIESSDDKSQPTSKSGQEIHPGREVHLGSSSSSYSFLHNGQKRNP